MKKYKEVLMNRLSNMSKKIFTKKSTHYSTFNPKVKSHKSFIYVGSAL